MYVDLPLADWGGGELLLDGIVLRGVTGSQELGVEDLLGMRTISFIIQRY